MKKHWTEENLKKYIFRITADLIAQLEIKMESENISQDKLAEKMRMTKGRISQFLNHPGNATLSSIIRFAKILGMKVSIVAYEDNDPNNEKGPINSEIFKICWEKAGKPSDFWAFQEAGTSNHIAVQATTSKHPHITWDNIGGIASSPNKNVSFHKIRLNVDSSWPQQRLSRNFEHKISPKPIVSPIPHEERVTNYAYATA